MDYFSLCLDGLCLVGQSMMHMIFISRLTGKKQKLWHCAVYLFLLYSIVFISDEFVLTGILILPVGLEAIALYGMSRFALRNQRTLSLVAAIFAVYIFQFSFGVVNSAEAMIFPGLVGKPLLYPLLFFATLLSFTICAFCYAVSLRFLSLSEDRQAPYIGLLLFPGLFFFAAELYILQTSYSVLPTGLSLDEAGKHSVLLLLQALGLGALLCTLYAYRRLLQSLQAQAALKALEQAVKAQRIYITEAQTRYEQTKAFRHDIKNHLSVLNGLLSNGKLNESKAYLQKLEAASAGLSFPYQTGNPVVDILLGEKLGLAKAGKVTAEVSLILPRPCRIDDFDLCVIFANALDNALNACQAIEGEKLIRVIGERQGDFYLLGFENTCSDEVLPSAGTGLSNIKSVAEKYHGAVLTEKAGRRFYLHVLLKISCNSSLHPGSISGQKY